MFYVMPKKIDLNNLAALFRSKVLQMLKKDNPLFRGVADLQGRYWQGRDAWRKHQVYPHR